MVQVRNAAGLVTTTSSLGYLLDSSPPDVGSVFDGPSSSHGDVDYWTDSATLHSHWTGFSDPHSDIVEYLWAIGSCSSCVDVQPFVSVGLEQGTFMCRCVETDTCVMLCLYLQLVFILTWPCQLVLRIMCMYVLAIPCNSAHRGLPMEPH